MIIESIERPPSEIVQGFKYLLSYDSITCAISDCMGRFNAMTSDMRPLFEGIRLVGTAVTVKTLAADLAAAFKAIDVCRPVILWLSTATAWLLCQRPRLL